MYNHIRGTLVHKDPARLVVEAGGIGYDISVPLSSGRKAPAVGTPITVLTHLAVREDDMRLFGFMEAEERDLFRRLIELSGIGPSLALQILSGISPRDFILAVERQDSGALKKIKGIGEKTAKRIILELKGAKMNLLSGAGDAAPSGPAAEAEAALAALGMPAGEAAARAGKAAAAMPDAPVEELIKAALR